MLIQIKGLTFWEGLSGFVAFLMLYGITLSVSKGFPVAIYLFYFFLPPLLLYYLYRFGAINKYFAAVFFALFGIGLYFVFTGENTLGGFLKIYISLFVIYLFSYYLIRFYEDDLFSLFRKYIQTAYFIVSIAFVQLFSFLIGFEKGYDLRWLLPGLGKAPEIDGVFRANSMLGEPSHYALVLSPALFVAICRFVYPGRYTKLISKRGAIFILLGFLISVSSSGFSAVFFALLLIVLRKISISKMITGVVVGTSFAALLYYSSEDFRVRLEGTISLFFVGDVEFNRIDASSFTLFNNAVVSYKNMMVHPVFGTGLGSHPIAYDKYTLTKDVLVLQSYLSEMELNREDANSLFLRLLSETGFFGIILLFIYFYLFYHSKPDEDGSIGWLTCNSILVFFFLALLRHGHYFLNGIPLFFFLYYFNYVKNKNGRQ